MKNYPYLKPWNLFVLLFTLLPFYSYSATYTAVLSGQWSSDLTWGGTPPPDTITSEDMIIINAGVTVDMDVDVMVDNELATISLLGNLEGSGQLTLESGTVIGTGTLAVAKIVTGAQGRIITTGSISCDTLESASTALALSANTSVDSKLKISSGLLQIQNAGSLSFGSNAVIEIAGGRLESNGNIQTVAMINLLYSDTCRSTGDEINAGAIANLTVDLNNADDTVVVRGNIIVNDTINLKSGIMSLNGFNLTLNGTSQVSANSSLTGDINSSLFVNGSDTVGLIVFSEGGGFLDSLVIDMQGEGRVGLNSDLEISGALLLNNGQLVIDTNDISVNAEAEILGGLNAFVNTSGEGRLIIELVAGDTTVVFPVGTDLGFFPCEIFQNPGADDTLDIEVRVMEGVFAEGTGGTDLSATASLVNNTWLIASVDTSADVDLNFEFFWSADAEVNSFNNSSCYISHFIDGAWDVTTATSAQAQANGQFSVKRSGITSLSPFSVMEKTTTNASDQSDLNIELFPNPVANVLQIELPFGAGELDVQIIDLQGRVVKNFPPTVGSRELNVSDLLSGRYTILLGGKYEKAFVKL